MSILILIKISTIIALLSHIWFKTDFFPFYCRLFKKILPKKLYLYLLTEEYLNRPPDDYIYESYIEYLYAKRAFSKNFLEVFILKLLSCPICLGVWLSVLSCLCFCGIFYTGIIFILVRSFDYLLNFFLKSH